MNIGGFGRRHHFVHARIRPTDPNIVGDRVDEKKWFLEHECVQPHEVRVPQVPEVNPVEQDGAVCGVKEAEQE